MHLSVYFDIACLRFLHRFPSKPASHPVKQVPLKLEHSFTSLQCPHVSLHWVPYDPCTHSETVDKHMMQNTCTYHYLCLVDWTQKVSCTNRLPEKRFVYIILSKMNIVKFKKIYIIKTATFCLKQHFFLHIGFKSLWKSPVKLFITSCKLNIYIF